MTELRTERLRLRHFTEDDIGDMVALDTDPDVIRYASPEFLDEPPDEAYERAYLERIFAGYALNHGYWVAEEAGAFLGWFFLRPNEQGEWELGYRLKQSAWGKGFGTEGATAVVRHGLDTLGLPLIYAEAVEPNPGSLNVLTKAGLTHVSSGTWMGMPDRRYEIRK